MDDVNINEMCLEEEVIADGDEWIKFSWIKQSDDNETSRQSLDMQKEDTNIETAQINDDDNKVLCINTEADDISDGISIITESDTDTVNTNILQISQFNGNTYRFLQILETQINKQTNIRNVLMACIIGIIIGFILSHSFIDSKACPNSNEINTESLKTVDHNIVNTLKGLTEVKTMLNEIKIHTAVDKKIMEHFREQFSKIDAVNKMSNKPTTTSESFNFDPYSLNQVSQLQMSLHVLSSLAFIYDNNSSLKNEINETLDIVNSTKAFYENLMLFNNNTQNEYNSFALKILQHDSDKIHITSKLLLSNLIERMSKITLNVYNKYTKEKHKLIKKLCDLKNILPDDEFLKQLTTNNQLFKNYDKSCLSNYSSKKLNTKTFGKKNTKIKNVKEQIRETDNTVQAKYDKEISQKIYNGNKKGSLKNERIKKLNEHNYTITKFFQNASDKIHNISQLLSSESLENKREMLNKDICTNKYNEAKHRWIKNKCHKDSSEFLERSTENNEENNRESINLCARENDYLQSIEIQKDDVSKDNFDNILIQSWKDMCPLSTNSCPKFNIDVPTLPTTSSCKTENCIVNSNNEHDANNKESVLDYESSTKVLFRKSKPKQKDYSRSNGSTKKVFNNDKNIKDKKKIFPQNKIKNPMSETDNYHKSKESSFKSSKQDNQDYINMNWQNDNKRFYRRKKQWQRGDSDWYFRRVFSRRKARRHAENIYQWNICSKLFWNKYQ